MIVCIELGDQARTDLKELAKKQHTTIDSLLSKIVEEYIDHKTHYEMSFL